MAIIEGVRTDSPHGYRYGSPNRFYYPEQNVALKEISDKTAQTQILEWYGDIADRYWQEFNAVIKKGGSDGDAYRAAVDLISIVLTQDELNDLDFHEALYLRKP